MASHDNAGLSAGLRRELKRLLDGRGAHAPFDAAIAEFPEKFRGHIAESLPYSAWQLLEHIRITQRDILDFCRNEDGSYKPLAWPADYWPREAAPPSAAAWERSVEAVHADRKAFEELLQATLDETLVQPFTWGDGQTMLHEALLIADHTAYHTGELILLRRLLGAWK